MQNEMHWNLRLFHLSWYAIFTDSWMWHFILCLCDSIQSFDYICCFSVLCFKFPNFCRSSLVDLGWLISTLKILVGWSLTNFCINRAIKTFPLAQSCSPALCWTWSLSTLYRPILVNQQEKMFWLCRRATKMAKNYQKALLSWMQWG